MGVRSDDNICVCDDPCMDQGGNNPFFSVPSYLPLPVASNCTIIMEKDSCGVCGGDGSSCAKSKPPHPMVSAICWPDLCFQLYYLTPVVLGMSKGTAIAAGSAVGGVVAARYVMSYT